MSAAAVFSPIPTTPGRPSLGSPRSTAMSAYACPDATEYFSASAAWSMTTRSLTPFTGYRTRTPAASSTSWNRSRSPVTTATAARSAAGRATSRATSVPITSSASYPGTPTRAMPSAASTSMITGTCAASAGGTSSSPVVPGTSRATRCALYDGIAATRNAGRQSSSQQATSRVGRWSTTSRAIMSSSPRTALTGVPSGARTESGTPKNARKYSEALSSSSSLSRGSVMGAAC